MRRSVYFTICANNYMAYALTLGRSLRKSEPNSEFVIVLADEKCSSNEMDQVEFPILEASELGLPTFDDMKLRYSVMEFSTAIKPRAIQYLMNERGFDQAIYLDPDLYILSPMSELHEILEGGANAVLTPHSCAPLDDGGDPDDIRLLRTGAYNLGFAGFSRSPQSNAFLQWWEQHLEADCRVALSEGLFVDQKFMDLAPCYLDHVHILRHQGYNTAYWNLMHRPVHHSEGRWTSGGAPLRFFHFSGVTPNDRTVFSKHQNRYDAKHIGELQVLLNEYVDQLAANGHAVWSQVGYAYDRLDEVDLDPFVRRVYSTRYPIPTRGSPVSMADLQTICNEHVESFNGGAPLTRYTWEIWAAREDLRKVFDIENPSGRAAFNNWLLTSGRQEHNISPRFLTHLAGKPRRSVVAPNAPSNVKRATSSSKHRTSFRSSLSWWILDRLDAIRPIYKFLPKPLVGWLRHFVVEATHLSQSAGPQIKPLPGPLESGIAIYGYLHTENGIGEGARQACRALNQTDIDTEAFSLGTNGRFSDSVDFATAKPLAATRKKIRVFHVNADQTDAVFSLLGSEATRAGAYNVGYWAWELERFPDAWAAAAEHLDEIWAPSRFTQRAIASAVQTPVACIPHAISIPQRPSATDIRAWRARLGLQENHFAFLNSFDFNSFVERKNPYAALAAFKECRKTRDDIVLIMKTHGKGATKLDRSRLLAAAAGIEGVHLIDSVLSEREMGELQWSADAFLSLHRSEGFGLGILEMMAKGKPVIATDYSGSTDFVDDSVGFPIRYDLVPVPAGAYPHAEQQHWADADIHEASKAMAALADDRELAKELGQKGRTNAISGYSHEAVGKLIKNRFK
jgi:glycosyltransferase involved in cell wall biosynthesis